MDIILGQIMQYSGYVIIGKNGQIIASRQLKYPLAGLFTGEIINNRYYKMIRLTGGYSDYQYYDYVQEDNLSIIGDNRGA